MFRNPGFYINGEWLQPTGRKTLSVINPATEQACYDILLGNASDVDLAVKAASDALVTWREVPLTERVALLGKLGEIYERRLEEMADAISLEMGAPRSWAMNAQAPAGLAHIKALLKALPDFQFEQDRQDLGARLVREPVGVCGLITPWNWPISQIALKVAPAVTAGCTVVLKPSEIAPLSGMVFADMMQEAGYPAGVFNLIQGDGPEVGAPLSKHPLVNMVSFTGSTRAGIAVSQAAAPTVKRVALELGGKSPWLVLEDADLPKAIKQVVSRCFGNTGQSCNASTRLLLPASRYEEALPLLQTTASQYQVGDTREEGRHLGPLVSEVQFNKVQGLIERGIDEGARLLVGGLGKPEGFERGYYVRPTVFVDVTPDMSISSEEIFGPVLSVLTYDDVEQGIAEANSTPYGLAAYLSGRDQEQCRAVARRMQAGMVHINGADQHEAGPFGGYKQSGIGREGGEFGLEDFLEMKSINGF